MNKAARKSQAAYDLGPFRFRTLDGKTVVTNDAGEFAILEQDEFDLFASGAIAGLDGVRGAVVGRVDSVTLTTRKPPKGLAGAPYVVERGIDLDALTEETVIFEGTAREACKGFPTNVNVSAALSLAGVGPDRTRVRIIAVPGGRFNQHRIEVRGEFGRLAVEIENVPSATNPRTGLLSIYSSIAFLADYARTTGSKAKRQDPT